MSSRAASFHFEAPVFVCWRKDASKVDSVLTQTTFLTDDQIYLRSQRLEIYPQFGKRKTWMALQGKQFSGPAILLPDPLSRPFPMEEQVQGKEVHPHTTPSPHLFSLLLCSGFSLQSEEVSSEDIAICNIWKKDQIVVIYWNSSFT